MMHDRRGYVSFALVAALALGGALEGCSAADRSAAPPQTMAREALGTKSQVPSVVGLPFSQAVCRLLAADLLWRAPGTPSTRVEPVDCEFSAERGGAIAPDPIVRGQKPAAGTVQGRGSSVTLVTDCDRVPAHAACA